MNFPQDDLESIRTLMKVSWQDHFDTRAQTWKSLQIEAILAAGLVGIDWAVNSTYATISVGILVMLAAYFGARIAIHHRRVMQKKLNHINRCEQALGLIGEDKIINDVKAGSIPKSMKFLDVINPFKHNTGLYIIRMHITILIFALIFMIARINYIGK